MLSFEMVNLKFREQTLFTQKSGSFRGHRAVIFSLTNG